MRRDPRIDVYIAKAEPFAAPILKQVRERVHEALPQVEETLKWSAPAFTLNGKILLMMAAFKAHATLNFWRGQELGVGSRKEGAMGQFGRLSATADLPDDSTFAALLREAAALSATNPGPRKAKQAAKAPLDLHPEFAAALAAHPDAKAMLDGFPLSAQWDYLEWINDAKRDSTRATRIATTIEWLAEGKKRHWKYEDR